MSLGQCAHLTQCYVASAVRVAINSHSAQNQAEQCPGGTPYNGLYGEAPPERGTFFRLQVYKR